MQGGLIVRTVSVYNNSISIYRGAIMQALCKTCGIEFEVKSSRHVYCSEQCQRGAVSAICVTCGITYPRTSSRKTRFCSRQCYYDLRREQNTKPCPICSKRFYPNRGRTEQKTCSHACADIYRRKDQKKRCAECRKTFICPKREQRFCSLHCAQIVRITNQGRRYAEGTLRNVPGGYLEIKHNGRWIKQHRHIMSQVLGRPLEKYEAVHHKNGIPSDNRIENLELCRVRTLHPPGHRVEDAINYVLTYHKEKLLEKLGIVHCPGCKCLEV